ncbi:MULTISPECIES: hypothetical protein [Actinotignum]|uniref:Lipoprotein n=1 Tax=Actinotignum timonense TaxID=1870995 RepID=A0AAW9HJU9_9ACTO|nr:MULTISPECIES: hypothetical protein [Actinotignum]MDK8534629.1 hypothetical protein [Gleimia europaea]MDE1535909.1 hypothetical protein [Actinotignum schaalii]MDE1558771.1 hypothetical protein [Actinotignum schaalii]MDE1663687.1 hypothetical protein [Actinotignum schaalii]MDK6590845.1 hypothetical protein [Actinotignum timonense]
MKRVGFFLGSLAAGCCAVAALVHVMDEHSRWHHVPDPAPES